jgi:methanogenic corrinoid protein MtbC1
MRLYKFIRTIYSQPLKKGEKKGEKKVKKKVNQPSAYAGVVIVGIVGRNDVTTIGKKILSTYTLQNYLGYHV